MILCLPSSAVLTAILSQNCRLFKLKLPSGDTPSDCSCNSSQRTPIVSDLTEVILMTKTLRESQMKIDTYYSKLMIRRAVANLSAHFLIAQHNVVESVAVWIGDVTKLGIALRNIRDVEMSA